MLTKLRANQRGDTLIEVIIATVIMGMVLLTAYSLSVKSYQLGRSARERSQATQLIQEQAEGLLSLRDSASNWSAFNALIPTNTSTNYHVERQGSSWQVSATGDWNPQQSNPELPPYYRININTLNKVTDHVRLRIRIDWERFGGGPTETSTLYYNLTDREIILQGS